MTAAATPGRGRSRVVGAVVGVGGIALVTAVFSVFGEVSTTIPALLLVVPVVLVSVMTDWWVTVPVAVLAALVRNDGKVMTYATLARVVWGVDDLEDHRHSLRIAISRVRKALGAGPSRPSIVTEHHVGYRLVQASC